MRRHGYGQTSLFCKAATINIVSVQLQDLMNTMRLWIISIYESDGKRNIRDAIHALDWMKENDKKAYQMLVDKIGLTEEETEYWEKIVDHMYFPYDEERKIYPLDDGFMMRKPWDDSKIPRDKRHLLYENYHPLFIYRQRMST